MATTGTVLHRTYLLLAVWFWAIYLVARDKRGVSYSSAWYLLHRLHKTRGKRNKKYIFSGVIELDGAYLGAFKSNEKRGRGTDKTNMLTAVSLTGLRQLCLLKMQVSLLDAQSMSAVAQQIIRPGSTIHSDALESFRAAL